jgi:hypothetical protein
MAKIFTHPFRDGVKDLLGQHFHESVVGRFRLVLERNIYDTKSVFDMYNNNRVVMEVHYENPNGLSEFICDLNGWESKALTTRKLLTAITDAYKAGRIGMDWSERSGKISREVSSGKHTTPLTQEEKVELITKANEPKNTKKSRNK